MTPIRLKIRRGPGQLFGTVTVDVSAIKHGKYNRYSANELLPGPGENHVHARS